MLYKIHPQARGGPGDGGCIDIGQLPLSCRLDLEIPVWWHWDQRDKFLEN